MWKISGTKTWDRYPVIKKTKIKHLLINYKDTKTKCHLKNWPVKGLCGRCLLEFRDWRYSQSCWYFVPALWTIAPLTFSLFHPPPLSLCQRTVCYWEGVRGVVLLETIFCRSLTLSIWPDSEPTKLLDDPKENPRRGGPQRALPVERLLL